MEGSPRKSDLLQAAHVSGLLQRKDFETVLSIVQDDFNKRPTSDTETRLRAMQGAINEIFSRMNLAFQRLNTMEFSADMDFWVRKYLACFDAIFTLNQDMLLELYYNCTDPVFWTNKKWKGCYIPGMLERLLSGPSPYDVLQSKWHPSGDFQLAPDKQPIIKLHGSSNWHATNAEPILVIGKAKVGLIAAHPVLNRYLEYFKECLSKPDTRVTVVGYSFADDHINDALLEAGRRGNMKMFVVHPRGRAILVRDPGALITPPEPLRDDIGSLGESIRPLSRTFRDDELERDALYAVLR
jgi:hypothetical protein